MHVRFKERNGNEMESSLGEELKNNTKCYYYRVFGIQITLIKKESNSIIKILQNYKYIDQIGPKKSKDKTTPISTDLINNTTKSASLEFSEMRIRMICDESLLLAYFFLRRSITYCLLKFIGA